MSTEPLQQRTVRFTEQRIYYPGKFIFAGDQKAEMLNIMKLQMGVMVMSAIDDGRPYQVQSVITDQPFTPPSVSFQESSWVLKIETTIRLTDSSQAQVGEYVVAVREDYTLPTVGHGWRFATDHSGTRRVA
jgi:hypothetical protein